MSKRKSSDGHGPREERKKEWKAEESGHGPREERKKEWKAEESGHRHSGEWKRKWCKTEGGSGGPSKEQYNASCLVTMFVRDLQPLSMIEGTGFRALLRELNPGLSIPKEIAALRADLLQLYESVKRDVKTSLQSANDVVLTSEVWTRGTESYQTIGCHFINHSWEFKSYLLNTSLTAANTSDEKVNQLQMVAEDWGIGEKIHALVMNWPVTLPTGLRWASFPCFAQNLDRIFNRAMKNDPADEELLNKCHKAIMFLRHSDATGKLCEFLPPCQLTQLGEPGWNSTFCMLEKILLHQKAINNMLSRCGQDTLLLNDGDLTKIGDIVFALRHFAEAVKDEPHQNYISASRMIPLITLMKTQLKKQAQNGNNVATRLEEAFSAKFDPVEKNYRLTVSTTLDPRFKGFKSLHPGSKEVSKKRLLSEILGKAEHTTCTSPVPQDNNPGGLWEDFDKMSECEEELRKYETREKIPREGNPLSWWQRNDEFPNLRGAARKYLGIVSTCVPTMQAFSKSGEVYRLQRLRLEPENVNMMLFLNSNFLQKI